MLKVLPKGKKLGDTSKHMPDMRFLLVSLSTLKPNHHFFSKSYKPPPQRKKIAKNQPKLNLPGDFFYNQPPPTEKMMRKACRKTKNMLLKLQKDPVPFVSSLTSASTSMQLSTK